MRKLRAVCVVLALWVVAGCQEDDPPSVFCPPPASELPPPHIPEIEPCTSGQVVLDAVLDRDGSAPLREFALEVPSDGQLCLTAGTRNPGLGLGGVLPQCGRLDWDFSDGPISPGVPVPVPAGQVLTRTYAPLLVRAWRDVDMTEPGLPVAFDSEAPTGNKCDRSHTHG